MLATRHYSLIAGVATVKGVILTVFVMTIFNATFWQGIMTVVVSAVLTGSFLLMGVWFTARETQRNREAIREVGKKVDEK